MSAPHIEKFLEQSFIVPGNPTFNTFVTKVAMRGNLGSENAARIHYYGGSLLTRETVELLSSIENGNGPDQHPLSRNILPIVRMAEDFNIGDMVYVRVPEKNASLSINYVSAVDVAYDGEAEVVTEEELTEDVHPMNSRGLVLIDKPGFGYYGVIPNWPALIPEEIVTAIDDRNELEKNEARAIAGYADNYFQSCFFDNLYSLSENFQDSAHRTPKNLRLMTYTRSAN